LMLNVVLMVEDWSELLTLIAGFIYWKSGNGCSFHGLEKPHMDGWWCFKRNDDGRIFVPFRWTIERQSNKIEVFSSTLAGRVFRWSRIVPTVAKTASKPSIGKIKKKRSA
jgi:hypothetical protein